MSNKIFEGFCGKCPNFVFERNIKDGQIGRCIIHKVDGSFKPVCNDTYCEIDNPNSIELLTVEEVKTYLLNQGSAISYDENQNRYIKDEDTEWWFNKERPNQKAYAIRNNMCLLDFDEWMALEDLLFGEFSEELPYGVAAKINNILWETMDISPMDLNYLTDRGWE